jgi:hypothetical protein
VVLPLRPFFPLLLDGFVMVHDLFAVADLAAPALGGLAGALRDELAAELLVEAGPAAARAPDVPCLLEEALGKCSGTRGMRVRSSVTAWKVTPALHGHLPDPPTAWLRLHPNIFGAFPGRATSARDRLRSSAPWRPVGIILWLGAGEGRSGAST